MTLMVDGPSCSIKHMPPRNTTKFSAYERSTYESIDDFQTAPTKPGFLTIDYNGSPLDLLRVDNNSATTVVVFHSSLSESVTSIPVFSGMGVLSGLDANVISVSDPTLELHSLLKLSWFAGNRNQPLQRDLPAILKKILDEQGARHVIFFGASGGGFAALYYSAYFPGSLAIPLNPQTVIRTFPERAVLSYGRVGFGARTIEQARNLLVSSITDDLRDVYRGGMSNTIAYVQNVMDSHHLYRHMIPFLRAIPQTTDVAALLGDWGKGHIAPPKEVVRQILEVSVGANGKWVDALASIGFTLAPDPDFPAEVRSIYQNSKA